MCVSVWAALTGQTDLLKAIRINIHVFLFLSSLFHIPPALPSSPLSFFAPPRHAARRAECGGTSRKPRSQVKVATPQDAHVHAGTV